MSAISSNLSQVVEPIEIESEESSKKGRWRKFAIATTPGFVGTATGTLSICLAAECRNNYTYAVTSLAAGVLSVALAIFSGIQYSCLPHAKLGKHGCDAKIAKVGIATAVTAGVTGMIAIFITVFIFYIAPHFNQK